MSQRDLAHVLTAMWRRSHGEPGVAVDVAQIDEDIGRGRGDMRTPLNLQALAERGFVVAGDDGRWALTAAGIAWVAQDEELSDR